MREAVSIQSRDLRSPQVACESVEDAAQGATVQPMTEQLREAADRLDRWIWNLSDRHLHRILLALLVLGSVLIRAHMAPLTISGDYQGFLTEWWTEYGKEGLWQSFSHSITNYYEPYSFLMDVFAHIPVPLWLSITATSCLAEYVGAWYTYRLLCLIGASEGQDDDTRREGYALAAIALLYLPMTMMNGALWKQCDAIYACFAVMSLYYLLARSWHRSFLFLSIAFVFKLQTGFLLPFYVMVYLFQKGFSILRFLYLPAAYLLAGLPAVLLGRGVRATYGKYLFQFDYLPVITASSPSIWRIGMKDYTAFGTPAILVTLAVLAAAVLLLRRHTDRLSAGNLLYLAGWTVWTCFIFLPEMHERYDYLALLLLTAYFLAFRRRMAWTMIVANLVTAMGYGYYLFEQLEAFEFFTFLELAIPYNLAYFAVTADLYARVIKGPRA